MPNPSDLRAAIGAIVIADTGAGGIVTLLGKAADPTQAIVRWGDAGMNDRPILSIFFPVTRGRDASGETDEPLVVDGQFDVHVERGSGALAENVLERLKVLLDWTAFDGQGLDVAPFWGVAGESPALIEGSARYTQEVRFQFNR